MGTDNRKTAVSLILLTFLLGATAVFAFPTLAFYTSDTGLRFIQIENLIGNDWRTLAIEYPWRAIDPDLHHLPYYFAYGLVDGQIFFNISPFFPMLAALFYAGLGRWGLLVIPLAATVATAVSLYHLARLTRLPQPRLLLWGTVFATPMLFYAFTVWDHTLGVALAGGALLAVAAGQQRDKRRLLLLGGLLIGLGVNQRPELYIFAIALGLALFTHQPSRNTQHVSRNTFHATRFFSYALGGFLGAAPLWRLNYRWVGHPLGMSVAPNLFDYGRSPTAPASSFNRTAALKHSRFFTYIEPGNAATLIATLLILVGILLLVYALRQRPTPLLLAAGAIIAVIGYGWLLSIAWPWPMTGVIATFPLIAFSLAYIRLPDSDAHAVYRLVYATAMLFIALLIIVWPTGGGKQWGTRYLLPVYPLLAFLAWATAQMLRERLSGAARRALISVAGLLLTTAVIIQLAGVLHLRQTRLTQAQTQAQLTALDADVILTNDLLLPAYMAGLSNKTFLFINSREAPADLVNRLHAHGVRRIALRGSDDRALTLPDRLPDVTVRPLGDNQFSIEAKTQ